MANEPRDDVRRQLNDRRVVPVIGAGVSRQVMSLPSWREAIDSALQHAVVTGLAMPSDPSVVRELCDKGDLVGAAHQVKQLLGAPGGEYPAWLKAAFGASSEKAQPDLIDAIGELLCPLIGTTNYDRLLTDLILDRPDPVTWRNPSALGAALRDGNHVLHLHGIYSDPDSVIFGADNYDALASAPGYEAVLKTLWLDRTLLFIGCSFGGLRDPDFTNLLDWAAATFKQAPWKHYALVFEGEVTTELTRKFLLDWRVQVIPFGPTYGDLATTLRELNPHAEQAMAHRVQTILRLAASTTPQGRAQIIQALRPLPAASTAAPPSLADVADTLLGTERRSLVQIRGDVRTMQALASSMIDRASLQEEIERYGRKEVTKFEGSFRTTVVAAIAALALFPEWLLAALKRRSVNIHGNYLSGYCRSVLEHLEKGNSALVGDRYTLENLYRILTSLDAVLDANPDALFPEPQEGTMARELREPSLVVLRSDRLEVRRLASPGDVVATLPVSSVTAPDSADIVPFDGADAICAFDREQIFIWDPRRAPAPVKIFKVEEANGINGAAHAVSDAGLSTILTMTDGPVHELHDLVRARTFWPLDKGFLSWPVKAGHWLYALVNTGLPITRTDLGRASPAVMPWLDAAWLRSAIARLPGVPAAIELRLAADRAYLGAGDPNLESRRNSAGFLERTQFQDLELSGWTLSGHVVLALSLTLRFMTTTASVVLLLDAESDDPRVMGHFFRDDASIVQFALQAGGDGRPRLLYALLADSEENGDMVGWARGAPTSQGWMFAEEGSSVGTGTDMIRVMFAGDDRGFASDDTGGLFEFSMADRTFREIHRDESSRIRALRLLPGVD